MSDLFHIEIITGNADEPRTCGFVWLCPEPGNAQDGNAIAVHDENGRLGYVSCRFTGLAREEYLRGAELRILSSLSQHVWYGALN